MRIALIFILFFVLISCQPTKEKQETFVANNSTITCNDFLCYGEYTGPEFYDGADIAHQFSNLMVDSVGTNLKRLFNSGVYSRVNLNGIIMRTHGMGTGNVRYELVFPFQRVNEKCDAKTAFDHAGGWGHKPNLENRKKELSTALLPNDQLSISALIQTKEGLQEYWIQWRHKEVQQECQK